ncbi:MAG: Brp/Blh family beta-carotene 15,15'-dioxygenase [Cyanobacteria bacterium P01_H01_bin.74]
MPVRRPALKIETLSYPTSVVVFYCLAQLTAAETGAGNEENALLLAVILGFCFGMPHGALDFELAKTLPIFQNRTRQGLFLLGYTLMALCFYWFWLLQPAVGVIIFLLLSAWHFGDDWRQNCHEPHGPRLTQGFLTQEVSVIKRFSIGLLFVVLPLLREDAVTLLQVFSGAASQSWAPFAVLSKPFLSHPVSHTVFFLLTTFLFIIGGLACFDWFKKRDYTQIAVFLVFIFSSIVLSPLYYFICYFCFFHSVKHFSEIQSNHLFLSGKQVALKLFPVLLATAGLYGLAVFRADLAYSWQHSFEALILLIASLTVPHMVFLETIMK